LCRQVGASRTLAWLFESMAAAALRRRHHGAGVFAHYSERSMPERADVAFGVLNAERHMRRREFLGLLGWAAAWLVASRAQATERTRVIGVLEILARDKNAKRGLCANSAATWLGSWSRS